MSDSKLVTLTSPRGTKIQVDGDLAEKLKAKGYGGSTASKSGSSK